MARVPYTTAGRQFNIRLTAQARTPGGGKLRDSSDKMPFGRAPSGPEDSIRRRIVASWQRFLRT